MIEVIVIENIDYVLRRLETEGYDEEIWTTREIKRRTGLSGGYLYSLERRGIINPIERTRSKRLIWMPIEVYEMLKKIKDYLSRRVKDYYG